VTSTALSHPPNPDVRLDFEKEDFEEALRKVSCSVGERDLKKYEEWMEEFGAV
jgi:hypothetical protein